MLEPLCIVSGLGGWFAWAAVNRIGLLTVGRSKLADGRTDPVRSWSVRDGQPLIVHDPGVVFVSVMLALTTASVAVMPSGSSRCHRCKVFASGVYGI